jgi:hypothetical protein
MTGHGAKFGRKKEEAIVALLSHRTTEEAARTVKVSVKTLLRWQKEPEFDAAYREAKRRCYPPLGTFHPVGIANIVTCYTRLFPPYLRSTYVETWRSLLGDSACGRGNGSGQMRPLVPKIALLDQYLDDMVAHDT